MENYLLVFSKLCFFLSFTFHVWISLSPFTKSTVSSLPKQTIVTNLIHRNSIRSPSYIKDSSISDDTSFIIRSSEERVAYLKAIVDDDFHPNVAGSLVPNYSGTILFVNVTVGEPPVPQLLIFDTGSGLLWVQCAPCLTCKKTKKPIYRPSKSSSYAPIGCHPKDCTEIFRGHCDSYGYCEYLMKYGDGSNSSGIIAFEKFTFPTYDRGTAVLNSLVFGCGTKYNDDVIQSNGVSGLSASKASPLASIASKFSYCLGSIRDPLDPNNFLIIGDDEAITEGFKTPFEVRNGLYYVNLGSVSVDYHKNITANPKEFKFNVIFDSGSSVTYLAKSLYQPLKAEVTEQLRRSGLEPARPPARRPNDLYYKGSMDSLPDIPIVFHLPGIDMDLNRESLFFQATDDLYCMAIAQAVGRPNVLGLINQQFSNIGFDLEANKISYRNTDCDISARSLSSKNTLDMI